MSTAAAAPATAYSELRNQWPFLAAAATAVMVSFASVFIYSFGVFLKPLAAEFGWSRGQISAGFSIAALTIAAASPVIGRVADRIGVRAVVLVCSIVFGVGFLALSTLQGSLWQYYFTLFVIGCAGNGATQLTWGRAIALRFDVHRGLALAIMMMGGGIGSLLVPAAATYLTERFGWRLAYAGLGTASLLAGPLIAFLALPRQRATDEKSRVRPGVPSLLRSPILRSLLAAFFLVSVGANGCIAHLVPLLTDRRFSNTTAAAALSVLGLSSVAGRLLTGFLIDRFFAPRVAGLVVAASAAGILMIAGSGDERIVYAGVVLLGFAIGAEADVFPYLISRYLGLTSFAELYGYCFSAYAIGGALGPLLMGGIYDRAHSYAVPLLLGAAATIAAAVSVLKLPRYQVVRS